MPELVVFGSWTVAFRPSVLEPPQMLQDSLEEVVTGLEPHGILQLGERVSRQLIQLGFDRQRHSECDEDCTDATAGTLEHAARRGDHVDHRALHSRAATWYPSQKNCSLFNTVAASKWFPLARRFSVLNGL